MIYKLKVSHLTGKQDVFFNPTLQHQTFKIKNKQWQTVFHLDWIFTEAYQVTEALVSLLQHWERKSVTIITHERQLRTGYYYKFHFRRHFAF